MWGRGGGGFRVTRTFAVHSSRYNVLKNNKKLTRTQAMNHQQNGNEKTPQQNQATGAQRGKQSVTTVDETSNQFHARENMQLISSAGKPAPSARKHAIGAKRGKTYNQRKAREATNRCVKSTLEWL